jgi:exonuclease SbcC
MAPRLQTLVIDNFRSIRGTIAIPMDAQVVLIHGTNGMGKTSVLSALELALTGANAHLAASGESYKSYITNLDSESGSIKLTTTGLHKPGVKPDGTVEFSNTRFDSAPLLDVIDSAFFAERCYLPQSTLGRLLEIYDQRKTDSSSPLTQFVKEILRIDPLDALVDGLKPAFHVGRIRNLVSEYRRYESLTKSLETEAQENSDAIVAADLTLSSKREEASGLLVKLNRAPNALATTKQIEEAKKDLTESQAEADALAQLERLRAELRNAVKNWSGLSPDAISRDEATKEQASHAAAERLTIWRNGGGKKIETVLVTMASDFPDLPSFDDGPEIARATAEARASTEATRCTNLTTQSATATKRVSEIQLRIQRSTSRITEIDGALSESDSVGDAQALASALAGIASHVHGEHCPICDRDFAEIGVGPLSTYIAKKIADLTTEAGRLQALARERAEQSSVLTAAQRDVLSAQQMALTPAVLAELTNRAGRASAFAQELQTLAVEAQMGVQLIAQASAARTQLLAARRQNATTTSLLPEIARIVLEVTGLALETFMSVDEALAEADRIAQEKAIEAESAVLLRVQAISALNALSQYILDLDQLRKTEKELVSRATEVEGAERAVKDCRDISKRVSDAAGAVRSSTVKTVFNDSLNKVWKDLFVRLAPSEDFVPMFRLPKEDREQVEAVLETYHRTRGRSGTPGAMLSQGNLNTAALTLFLALHLSVPSKMPWLVLDDPVQSMDDVHVAQFAALLRSLSKSMDRQLIVAVHERALFDYLTLELSPAFQGDSLIAVEIGRNFEGDTVATPIAYGYKDDNVIAA